ncbi:MAG: GNAT family N-acetyltransferase [Dehalococcoidia bacterium]
MSDIAEARANIRRMTRDDIHDVLALDRVAGGPTGSAISYGDMAAANPGTPPDLSFVAEVDGQIVGFMINRLAYLMVPLMEVCIIHAILVHPDYQRRGIGSKLIQTLLNECQNQGVDTIRILIPEANKELQALFEEEGFQRSHVVALDKTFQS